jgi:uncharacterized protein
MGEQSRIDPKIKIAWLFPTAIVIAIIWLILSASTFFMPPGETYFSIPRPLLPLALFAALIIFLGIPSYAWVHLSYTNFTYELAETELIIREGIFTRKTSVIPYVRIQNINSERTVFERLLGLATLSIETAGTNPGESEAQLPGISNRYELINHILALAAEAKQNGSMEERAAGQRGQVSRDQVFHEILGQLVQLNKSIISSSTRELSREKVSQEMLEQLRSLNSNLAQNGKQGSSLQSVPKKPK